jgi:hypothetical protein
VGKLFQNALSILEAPMHAADPISIQETGTIQP